MPQKLPACEPCSFPKLACDHAQPVCSRCKDKNQTAACIYRSRPFKKKKMADVLPALGEPQPLKHVRSSTHASLPEVLTKPRHYPNPGYLRSCSHTTLFDYVWWMEKRFLMAQQSLARSVVRWKWHPGFRWSKHGLPKVWISLWQVPFSSNARNRPSLSLKIWPQVTKEMWNYQVVFSSVRVAC